MISTAIIIALVFGTVYYIVRNTVYSNLDRDLGIEANEHRFKVEVNTKGLIYFLHKSDLLSTEHSQAQVNPVFLQLINDQGDFVDKSPNLKKNNLHFKTINKSGTHFNTFLNNEPIRQVQIPIWHNGKIEGYVLAAMSLKSSLMVLKNLRNTLYILYPIILFGLFFISSFLAGRSIQPVVSIIETTDRITKENLHKRVDLPATQDELHTLSISINALLQRIENAMLREQQFTSDASHELRTPLSILRGTLEVLLRKPRTIEEYNEKINSSLLEVNRIALILDQLLEIARNEESTSFYASEKEKAISLMNKIIRRQELVAHARGVSIDFNSSKGAQHIQINAFFGTTILENLLTNAIKYSKENGKIKIDFSIKDQAFYCSIQDFGIGIRKEDLIQIFQPFFRSDALSHQSIKGSGLGLSIVQKAAKAIRAEVSVRSVENIGTTFEVKFTDFLRES